MTQSEPELERKKIFVGLLLYMRFVFEMGGSANNAPIHAALADVFAEHGLRMKATKEQSPQKI